LTKKLLLDSLWTVVTRFVMKGTNLIVFAILARKLSLQEFGYYGYVVATTLLLSTIFDFGTRHSTGYFLGTRPDAEAQITLQAHVWSIVFSILGAVIFGAWLYLDHDLLSNWSLLVPAALTLPPMLAIRVQQGIVLGKGMMGPYNQSESLPRTLLFVVTMLLLVTKSITLESSLWALCGTFAVAAIYLSLVTVKLGVARGMDISLTKKILHRGMLFVPGVVLMIASRRISILMLENLNGPEAAGLYFGVVRISETLTEIALAIGIVIFSHNIRAASQDRAIADAARVVRCIMPLLLVMCATLFVSAKWVIPIALGSHFGGQEVLFRIALAATWIGSLWIILYPSLSALCSPIVSFWVFVPGVTLNVILTYFFAQKYGAVGASYALLITQVVLSASFLFAFHHLFRAKISSFLFIQKADVQGLLKVVRGRRL